ncbi:MAG TPA: hypothetical protein VHJ17_04965 [Thermomonospora sp.]|nr:hypothetical protein [Thermomonospora sp.]
MKLSLSSAAVSPGGTAVVTARVASGATPARDVRVQFSGSGFTVDKCTVTAACRLGTVTRSGESVSATVTVSSSTRPGTTITVYATLSAASSVPQTHWAPLSVVEGTGGGGGTDALPPGAWPGGATPLDSGTLPQVVLPPVASPQIAPGLMQMTPVAAIGVNDDDDDWFPGGGSLDDVAAVHAGWLSALLASVGLLLTSLLASRRSRPARPGAFRTLTLGRDVRRKLDGKRPTPARLRTLPPEPADPPKPAPRIRVVWLPMRSHGVHVRRSGPAGA